MRKWIASGSVLLCGYLIWFLFVRPYDFTVSFKANTLPGTINQSIKLWNSKTAGSIHQKNYTELIQQTNLSSGQITYHWKIKQLTDTLSQIIVYVKDKNTSVYDKLKIPFSNTSYEVLVKNDLTDYLKLLNDRLKNSKVEILGPSTIAPTYCAFIPIKGKQLEKAGGMMANYGLLSTLFIDQDVELNGRPFIEVTKWDQATDSLYYNFCFPIIKKDSLPQHKDVKYKQFEGGKALKAIYNGNYLTSDRAWYALQNYAEKNNLVIKNTPVEVFENNPNIGGNELEWKAYVYLPLN